MPIWFEITVIMLSAYGLGVAAGWALWNRPAPDSTVLRFAAGNGDGYKPGT